MSNELVRGSLEIGGNGRGRGTDRPTDSRQGVCNKVDCAGGVIRIADWTGNAGRTRLKACFLYYVCPFLSPFSSNEKKKKRNKNKKRKTREKEEKRGKREGKNTRARSANRKKKQESGKKRDARLDLSRSIEKFRCVDVHSSIPFHSSLFPGCSRFSSLPRARPTRDYPASSGFVRSRKNRITRRCPVY